MSDSKCFDPFILRSLILLLLFLNLERKLFLSGVQDGVVSQSSVTDNDGNWEGHIGVKDSGTFDEAPLDGYVDEFKYHYGVLNPTGKCMIYHRCITR